MKETLLTRTAVEKIQADLDELIAKRKEISEEIKNAREFGDLSENAEYHAARESQTQNEDEIQRLKYLIENATIVEGNEYGNSKISMNSKVKVKYVKEKMDATLKIVSTIEADPFNDFISNESPVGSALLGKSVGDTVEVSTPGGVRKIKVLEIMSE